MTTAHAYKLQQMTRCPCCGADSIEMEIDPPKGRDRVVYTCKATFTIANGQIIPSEPCHAGAQLAARLMNAEVKPEREAR